MELRRIQEKTINRIYYEAQAGNKKILVMLPTGSGKTIIARHLINACVQKNNRALFTVPRINLIAQTTRNFNESMVSVVQGDDKRFDPEKPIQIATIQTLNNRIVENIQLVIFDEVHYAYEGELIQSVFKLYPNAIFIGLSATPVDDRGYLLEGWDCIIDDYQLNDVINEGWLVPLECYTAFRIDLSAVKIKMGEYDETELAEKVNIEPVMKTVLQAYKEHANGLKFICFAVNKKHGSDLAEMFNKSGYPTKFVHSETPIKEREQMYSDLSSGVLLGLVSIEILTTGFDDPTISCIIGACPSKSWRKYIQFVGRGVRLNGNSYGESCSNGKSKCIFLDCGGLIVEHGLPTDRKKLIFKTKISRTIDRELGIDDDNEQRKTTILEPEKIKFLKRIGSLLDLYEGKIYNKENDLQEDVNSFLEKTGWFWWRQNSGKMFKDGRWIHFASKSGLPDNTLFFYMTSIFIGIELKLYSGTLTDHQKQTLPEMLQMGVLVFFAQSVADVWGIIKHIEQHTIINETGITVLKSIYEYPEQQIKYLNKYKLKKPAL